MIRLNKRAGTLIDFHRLTINQKILKICGDKIFMKKNCRITIIIMFFFCLASSTTTAETKSFSIDEIKQLIPDSTVIENKVVYLDFWASWCVPCRKSFRWMKEISEKYSDSGLIIITVNVDKDRKAADKFLKNNSFKAVNLFDPAGEIAKAFKLDAMPTSFLFDKTGKFIFKHTGFTKKESNELEKKIVTLIHKSETKNE